MKKNQTEWPAVLPDSPSTDPRVGKRVRVIEMKDNEPIEHGQEGTITHVGGGVLNVDWDCGRSIGLIDDVDSFEIVD